MVQPERQQHVNRASFEERSRPSPNLMQELASRKGSQTSGCTKEGIEKNTTWTQNTIMDGLPSMGQLQCDQVC